MKYLKKKVKIGIQEYTMNRCNEKLALCMGKWATKMKMQGEPFRARAYLYAQNQILQTHEDICSIQDLISLQLGGIGPTILKKCEECFFNEVVDEEFEEKTLMQTFANIYGVGPKKAEDLVRLGYSSIEQLREAVQTNELTLTDAQRHGLTYYEDILERIPRSEIEDFEQLLAAANLSVPYQIVGSFRRGAADSGDIDIVLSTNAKSNNNAGYTMLIDSWIQQGIILHVLSRGPSKCLVIAKHPNPKYKHARRVDFLYSPIHEYPFALLYFTGSQAFNIAMRQCALDMGYTMNEHGIKKTKNKEKMDVEKNDTITGFDSEQDIFAFLKMEYKTPAERIDGRAIVFKKDADVGKDVEGGVLTAFLQGTNKKPKNMEKDVKGEEEGKGKEKKTKKNVTRKNKKQVNQLQTFKTHGISYLDTLEESALSNMLKTADKQYFVEEDCKSAVVELTDNEYDILKEFTLQKFPCNKQLHTVGQTPKCKVDLPFSMGGMNKNITDLQTLYKWKQKYHTPPQYMVSCKLDGISGLYDGRHTTPKLYTRGNGKEGQDITRFLPALKHTIPCLPNVVLRGEIVMHKETFETLYADRPNSRNTIGGWLNKKIPEPHHLQYVIWVIYEVIFPVLPPLEQMAFLQDIQKTHPFLTIVPFVAIDAAQLTHEWLTAQLLSWRTESVYPNDGLVVSHNHVYERPTTTTTSGTLLNPKHSFAFKMALTEQMAEVKVLDVIWTPSKDGYLKPRIHVEKIQLGGVQIEFVTGINASFVTSNGIGVGAVVEIIRSGDVIPKITKVIVPAQHCKMPNVPYQWNASNIDIMLMDADLEDNETVREKRISGFFQGLNVDGLSSGNVARLMSHGFDTVAKILHMSHADFMQVDGFQTTMATKLYEGIQQKVAEADLCTFMSATHLLGRGFHEKKIKLILQSYPDICISQESEEQKLQTLLGIKGLGEKSARDFLSHLPDFLAFVQEAHLEHKLQQKIPTNETNKTNEFMQGMKIVFSGVRDAPLQSQLESLGCTICTQVSKQTKYVLVKNENAEETSKILYAKEHNIPIVTIEAFKQWLLDNL